MRVSPRRRPAATVEQELPAEAFFEQVREVEE